MHGKVIVIMIYLLFFFSLLQSVATISQFMLGKITLEKQFLRIMMWLLFQVQNYMHYKTTFTGNIKSEGKI